MFIPPAPCPSRRYRAGRTHTARAHPLTGLVESYRAVLLFGHRPAWAILSPLGFAGLLLAVTLPVYLREQKQFAKIIE